MGRFLTWWHARSKGAQIGMAAGFVLLFFILIGALASIGDEGEKKASSPPPPAAQPPPPPPPPPAEPAEEQPPPPPIEPPPPPPPTNTPKDRVRDEIGDTVKAGGYAGDLEIRNVAFEGREAQVTVTTPEG